MVDQAKMRLGRKAIKTDTRTLGLRKYLTPSLPPPPNECDWTKAQTAKGQTSWGTMLNDTYGDCTIAGVGHAIQVWSANTGSEVTVPDSTILSYYEQWDGYVLGDDATDSGGIELDVLNDWKKQGFAGNQLLAFADPQVGNLMEIRQAINLFGGVYIGISLPLTAQNQDVWDEVPDPGDGSADAGSWGGHCVFVPAYDQNGFTCITWGQLQTMTVAFWNKYCDEAHALLSADWLGAKGSPAGFDQAQLEADLKSIV
jgi:hypothetical protein